MSARVILGFVTLGSIGTVLGVHIIQKRDSDRMYESVKKEIELEESAAAAAAAAASPPSPHRDVAAAR